MSSSNAQLFINIYLLAPSFHVSVILTQNLAPGLEDHQLQCDSGPQWRQYDCWTCLSSFPVIGSRLAKCELIRLCYPLINTDAETINPSLHTGKKKKQSKQIQRNCLHFIFGLFIAIVQKSDQFLYIDLMSCNPIELIYYF